LSFVPSKSQLADLFTKPLSGPSLYSILGKLGLSSFPSNLRGDVGDKRLHSHKKGTTHVNIVNQDKKEENGLLTDKLGQLSIGLV